MSYDRPRGYYAQKFREAEEEITTNVWTIYVSSQKCQWCDAILCGEGHYEDESRERLRKKRQLHISEGLCPGIINESGRV